MDFYPLMAALTVHVLSGVFWAGSTSAMANLGSIDAARLFPFQMGSAGLTVLTGLAMWAFELGDQFYTHEQILLVGIVAAVIAGGRPGQCHRSGTSPTARRLAGRSGGHRRPHRQGKPHRGRPAPRHRRLHDHRPFLLRNSGDRETFESFGD